MKRTMIAGGALAILLALVVLLLATGRRERERDGFPAEATAPASSPSTAVVVRLDEQWKPTAISIPLLISTKQDSVTVMEAIRHAVPDDRDVREALLYEETKASRETRSE